MSYSAKLNFSYDEINDEIALLELRRILLVAYDFENNNDSLSFVYKDSDFSLNLINNRLVLEPGYQMFLDKVDYLCFSQEGNSIYLNYEKNNKEYKTPILKQKGIYLDEFSDFYDELDEYSNDDE